MKNPNEKITFNIGGAKPRYETLEGKKYLVVPMVMLTEGVHAGSNGPLFYPRKELAKTPVVWNHKPLVVYHPQVNGQGVSACTPNVLETRKVGLVMNTRFNGKLRAEAWFDEPKLKKVDERVLNSIKKGEMVEVSTGLFTDNVAGEGEWNGEKYVATATNYRPDHLAILPDTKGACSIADGAGLLQLNQASQSLLDNQIGLSEGDQEKLLTYNRNWPQAKRDKLPKGDFAGPNESFPIKSQADVKSAASLAHHAKDPAAVKARIKSIAKRKGLKVPKAWAKETTTNDSGPSHTTIRTAIREALQGRVKTAHGVTGGDHFVHDVYDDFFISGKYDNGQQKYYAQPYEVEPQSGTYTGKDSDKPGKPLKVKLTGIAKEVKQKTSWHDMEGNLVANHQNPEDRVEEVKARMIKELAVNGYNTKAEQQMLQRMKPENVAMLLQKSYMLAANTWSDASRAAARNALRSHGYSQHSYSNQQGGRETFAKGNHLVSLSQKGWKSHGVLAARTGLHGHGEKSGTLKAHLEGIHGKPTRNDGAGAGSAAGGSSAGGAPSGGSSNPADKMMAQRKARTPKKKRKPMNGVLAPNGTASY